MRIILDTDEKTITVPWNYSDKLEEMNKAIFIALGDTSKFLTYKDFINDIWIDAMKHSDTRIKTGQKPQKPTVKKPL